MNLKLNRNNSPISLPEGSSTFALNSVTDLSHESSVCNEQGNAFVVDIPHVNIGSISINRTEHVLFCINNSLQLFNSELGTLTEIIQNDDFNFNENYKITGTSRIIRGCETVIYWHDHLNADRYYNLTRPEKHTTLGLFDITKTEFNPEIIHSTISREILNSGGKLEYGTYNFSIEFLNQNEDSFFITPVDINYTPIIYQTGSGALNLATNLPDVGGRPPSNQSIKLTVTNVPEDAILARVIVFRHITGDGFTSDAHVVGSLIPISTDTFEYVYRGFDVANGDYLVDKNKYLQKRALYKTSLDGLQVNKRLVRYNLKESVRDYSNYQQKASKVRSKYVVKEVLKADKNIHLLNQTFLGGEIILPCIHYVHTDGTVSNAYPLIGRTKNDNDKVLVDDIFNPGQQIEKWKLYDTTIKDATPINGYYSSGEFGYYESDQTYFAPPNFCGERYWGTDAFQNTLEGEKVRLFVVPDRSVEKHETVNYVEAVKAGRIYPIGIWFDETTIEYPNDDVVGHYFSVVEVSQSNIDAKGIGFAAPLITNTKIPNRKTINAAYIGVEGGPAQDNLVKTYNFLTAKGIITEKYVNGSHAILEGFYRYIFTTTPEQSYKNIFDGSLPYDDLKIRGTSTSHGGYLVSAEEAKIVATSEIILPMTTINNTTNSSVTNTFNLLTLDSKFTNTFKIKYISVRNNINPIPNIWSIKTRRITDLNGIVSFNGDNFISPLNIDNIVNISVDGKSLVDHAISYGIFGFTGLLISLLSDGKVSADTETILDFYTESKVNTYLRHQGTDSCNTTAQIKENAQGIFLNKIIEPYKDKYKLRDSICKFFPGYNLDYSHIQNLNLYAAIGLTFDFCSGCTGLYPNRIIFSPQSFSEDLYDGYRINLPNDYIDIPADTGAIMRVDFRDNKLVVRTERSCYFLQPNPQQLETSESNVYIGTGDFLSIPPQELSISQPGYGGQQHKLDSINFERGLVWSDRQRGDIYYLGGEFKELHGDMIKWFSDNLKGDSHLLFTYDPEHERILLTKKNGWTLSYCFKSQGWKSWHSYIPDWYLYDANTFYSISNKKIWKHQSNKFCEFYGLKFPHIVELILKAEGNTFLPQSVHYHANVYNLANGYEQDVLGMTYDKMLCYNDIQSTGLQNLILNGDTDIYYVPTDTHVKQTDRNYKITPLKDLATSSNIWTLDITPVKQGVHGYMDKLPIVNANKEQVEIGNFRSKWLAVRLYFSNNDNKISLEFLESLKSNSVR